MKRVIAFILVIALCMALCACDGGSSSGNRCTICKKTATFQNSKYCDSCYEAAVKWAFNNVAGK